MIRRNHTPLLAGIPAISYGARNGSREDRLIITALAPVTGFVAIVVLDSCKS